MSIHQRSSKEEVVGFVGVGLDGKDGHVRITTSRDFLLFGGSEKTHKRMQEAAIKFGESLDDLGKTLRETSLEEAIDLLKKALER